jgi:hypothetical protein
MTFAEQYTRAGGDNSRTAPMLSPRYVDLNDAREILAEMGVELTRRQMKRAADKDVHGRRKLPFFIDPIDGKLKIEKGVLTEIYRRRQIDAQRELQS